MGLPDQAQNVTMMVVRAILAVSWLEANAGTTEQEMAVPTPEQLSRVSISARLDLFKTTCKILRISKEIKKNLDKTKIDVLVPCGDDGLG